MRIALVQNHPVFGAKKENIESLIAMMGTTKADIYVLPELAYSGYQFISKEEAKKLADPKTSADLDTFRKAAKDLDACIVFGFPELSGDRVYNSALAVLPDGREYLYRKTHLFYKEKLHFSPGDTGFTVFEFREAKIGIAICFDWFFPESFRTLALRGADIVAHCSNLVLPYCQKADFAAAVQNKVFIATANRVGTERREEEALAFTGSSVLVSPRGEYILEGPKEAEAVLSAEIDPAAAREKRLNPWNEAFEDRRPEFYGL